LIFNLHKFVAINVDHKLREINRFLENIFHVNNDGVKTKTVINIKLLSDKTEKESLYVDHLAGWNNNLIYLYDREGNRVGFDYETIFEKEVNIYVDEKFDCNKFFVYVLEPIIRMNLIANNDIVMLHSSAVGTKEGVLVFPAWGGTGKTNLMLELLSEGYDFYGDDLVLINQKGQVFSYLKPLNLFDYNLKAFPHIKLNKSLRTIFVKVTRNIINNLYKVCRFFFNQRSLIIRVLGILLDYSKPASNIKIDVSKLFPNIKKGNNSKAHIAFFLVKSSNDSLEYRKINNIGELTNKIIGCHNYEWKKFEDIYYIYQFSSGKNLDRKIDEIKTKEREILNSFFNNVDVYQVFVPKGGMNGETLLNAKSLVNKLVKDVNKKASNI
jgi:hypothetical protein